MAVPAPGPSPAMASAAGLAVRHGSAAALKGSGTTAPTTGGQIAGAEHLGLGQILS
eukprot:CAMPEP_0179363430 /NCGR_PEP_ID=MMETSP0797-20121207/81523_1 /TAXON_ID=47934 /ORGANISM="Dinophysis acuminata, Strain DAEP01" /LENGTH=55 /DNA_ID=CAMNT_0021078885 /DNA_START=59 /DNA_END=222 /DNA_ORIENTATION=-